MPEWLRSGLPKSDISSGEAVKKAVLAAKSVAYSSGPSGFYLAALFQKRALPIRSELVHVKKIEYLGPLPAEIQEITVYSAGLHSASKVPEAGKALVQFLSGPKAGTVINKIGMDPA